MIGMTAAFRQFVLAAAVGVALAVLLALADPLGLRARGRQKAEAAAVRAVAQAHAQSLAAERAATRALTTKVVAERERMTEAARATAQFEQIAREDKDAQTPLGSDRLGRIGEHDRRLCELAADLGGCGTAD